jgi:hypothetical protein
MMEKGRFRHRFQTRRARFLCSLAFHPGGGLPRLPPPCTFFFDNPWPTKIGPSFWVNRIVIDTGFAPVAGENIVSRAAMSPERNEICVSADNAEIRAVLANVWFSVVKQTSKTKRATSARDPERT